MPSQGNTEYAIPTLRHQGFFEQSDITGRAVKPRQLALKTTRVTQPCLVLLTYWNATGTKMKQLRSSEKTKLTRTRTAFLHITVLCVLSACGSGTPESAQTETDADIQAGPSASAAQLSYDDNHSVDFAQSVASGLEDAPKPQSSTSPQFSAANPDTGIPTVNSADSIVLGNTNDNDQSEGGGSDTDNPDTGTSDTGTSDTGTSDIDTGDNPGTSPFTPIEPGQATESEIDPSSTDADGGSDSGEENGSGGSDTGSDNGPDSNIETDADGGSDVSPSITEPDVEPVAGESEGDDSVSETDPPVNENTDTQFFSVTTPGFNGEVLEDSIRVTWPVDPNARGYNVYRQAQFVTSVFTEEYIDEDVFDDDYYYEIQAFDNSDTLYYVATGLTVKPRSFGRIDPDAPVPNNNILDGYELVFSDEFNGSELDASKWNTSYLWGPYLVINSEEQFYVDILNDPSFGFNPFTFDGNHMTINSIKTPPELLSRSMNQPYLSGVITSYDAFKFTYGYMETRAKVTFGRGYWPAFWLLNAYYVDDKPEIDIMEFIGHDQDVVYHTYHYYDSEGNLRSTESKPTPGVDYTSDFHTYAAEWRPGTIIFYIDNVEVHRVTDPKVSQQEMYVIANTALGGWWAGPPDESTPFPGEFTMDYIRVYQKSQPYDDTLFEDYGKPTAIPYADEVFGRSSPSHRPSIEDWPEGYPDGL